jgi:hypothetical protein
VFHGQKLMTTLSAEEAELIRQILDSNKEDLQTQLQALDAKVRHGEKGGGGVLGHIAEFLVSQRGVTR